jgi:hypothetical protein
VWPVFAALIVVALAHPKRRVVAALLVAYATPMVVLTLASLVVRPVLITRVLVPAAIPLVLLLGSLVDGPVSRRLLIRRYDPRHRLDEASQITIREAITRCGPAAADRCLDESLGRVRPGQLVWTVRAYDVLLPAAQRWLAARLPVTATHTFRGLVIERRAPPSPT